MLLTRKTGHFGHFGLNTQLVGWIFVSVLFVSLIRSKDCTVPLSQFQPSMWGGIQPSFEVVECWLGCNEAEPGCVFLHFRVNNALMP